MNWKNLLALASTVVVAGGLMAVAQETKGDAKKAAPAKKGILNPDWKAETGSYEAPHGKIGEKTDQAWSATTIGAGINGKPLPGRTVTVVGEIVDFSCYLQLGKHGEKHRSCGQKCVNNGQPIGLLAKDGSLYMLMEEEHDPRRDGQVSMRAAAAEHMAHIMEVTGTQTQHNGYRAIYVSGFLKK